MKFPMFLHPYTAILSGATGSGKTQWLKRFLQKRKKLIKPELNTVLYCYGELNSTILDLQASDSSIEIYNGVPTEDIIREKSQKHKGLLLILDDLLCNLDSDYLDILFTRGSHNWGVSVIVVTQHLFTKQLRVARNNMHYLILMRNPVGELQVRNLASQIFTGENFSFFKEAYKDATKNQFSYLIINMHPTTPDHMRLITNIYEEESEFPIVYVPRSGSSQQIITVIA